MHVSQTCFGSPKFFDTHCSYTLYFYLIEPSTSQSATPRTPEKQKKGMLEGKFSLQFN